MLSGAVLGRELLSTITQFEQLDQRLMTLSGSSETFAREQEYIRETIKRLSRVLAAMTDQYTRLLTLQNSGLITKQQARALLEGFADAAAATGASTAQLNQVMYGLSQALSSGVVRAEELNQVTEPMPGLMQAMEKAAGLSAGGLRRLVNEGRVTSEMFGQIMVAALQEFAGEAEKRSDTLDGKWQQLNTTWTELQLSLSEPVVDVLAPILETAKDLLGTVGPLLEKWLEFEQSARASHGRCRGCWALWGRRRTSGPSKNFGSSAISSRGRFGRRRRFRTLANLGGYISNLHQELEAVQKRIDELVPNVSVTGGQAAPITIPLFHRSWLHAPAALPEGAANRTRNGQPRKRHARRSGRPMRSAASRMRWRSRNSSSCARHASRQSTANFASPASTPTTRPPRRSWRLPGRSTIYGRLPRTSTPS